MKGIVAPPEEVRLKRREGVIELIWTDGRTDRLTFTRLRGACACSGCDAQRRRGAATEVDPALEVTEIRPMGVSGLQFLFSDGHSRGHYPWDYLRVLGEIG